VTDPIVVIDSSEIREGKLEELKTALEGRGGLAPAPGRARLVGES